MNNDNNKPETGNDIDDILEILQKRKTQDIMNGNVSNDCPTRIDTNAVKKQETVFSFSSDGFSAQNGGAAGNEKKSDMKNSTSSSESKTAPAQNPVYDNKPNPAPSPMAPVTPCATPPKQNVNNIPAQPSQKPGVNDTSNNKTKQVPVSTVSKEKIPTGQRSSAHQQQSTPSSSGAQSHSISLNDFDDKNLNRPARKGNGKNGKKSHSLPGWLKVIIYLVLVVSASVLISITAIKLGNDVFAFVKPERETTLKVSEKDTLSHVANALYEADIIEYPWVFEHFAKYRISKRSYLGEDIIEGEHLITAAMNYDQIITKLFAKSRAKNSVRVTIPEGYTFNDILNLFIESGIMKEEDKENYLTQLQEFEYEYDFITKLKEQGSLENKNRIHRLEGYLFPDTYDFYMGENPVSALDRLFANFENKFSDEMYKRADELGMTVDEIMTLASIIEAEGDSPANFAKISSVFHNRLNDKSGKFGFLGSDATTLYALRIAGHDKKTLSGTDTDFVHPYNTYTSLGLPPGPICNPGIEAINAALYPDSTNYLYFLTMANGETVFARTAAEHNNNIAKSNRIAAEKKASAQ